MDSKSIDHWSCGFDPRPGHASHATLARPVSGGRTIAGVKKSLLLVVAFLVFMRWRHERFEASDAANGYGAYAPVRPVT